MRLVAYTDPDGFERMAWLRDRDPDEAAGAFGIPHDPPPLDSLALEDGQTRTLHNALVARRLIAWRNASDFKRALVEAGEKAGLDAEQILSLKRLYTSGPPPEPEPAWALETALDMLPCNERQRQCIKSTFTRAGIRDLAGVENAPARVGHICGLDIYQIVAHLLGKEV